MMPSVLPEPSQVTVRSRIWTGSPVLAELSTYALDARTKLIGPSCFSTVPVVDPPTYVRSPASTMPLVSRQVPMIWITVPGALVSITACILAASPVLSRHVTPDTPGGRPAVARTTTLVLVLEQAASAMHPMAIHGTQQAIHGTRWVLFMRPGPAATRRRPPPTRSRRMPATAAQSWILVSSALQPGVSLASSVERIGMHHVGVPCGQERQGEVVSRRRA